MMKLYLPNLSEDYKKILPKILDDFASATELTTAVIDIKGQNVSEYAHYSSFCKAIQNYSEFGDLCKKCNMCGGFESSKAGAPSLYRCHASLTNIAIPLIIKSSLLGFILLGQSEAGIDDEIIPILSGKESDWMQYSELRQLRKTVVEIPVERIRSAASLLEHICNQYSQDIEQSDRILLSGKPETQKVNNRPGNEEMQRAIQFILNNVTKPISLGDVADHVYLSENYLSKRFNKEVGMSFKVYLNHQRIDLAKVLLQTSDISVEKIAHNIGFTHANYFCKVFSQYSGTTPESYRKRFRQL